MKNIEKETMKKSILKTILFFDIFNYPLTDLEIFRYLNLKCDYGEMREELKMIPQIENKNSMYFLKGRSEIYKTRMSRYNYTDRKFRRALFVSKIFRFIPWIKMIAIVNLIGSENLKDESDIDFFIITEKNRIWLTRLFSVLIIKILNLRPKENDNRDKICLSFFISEEDLDLKKFMLKNNFKREDYYFIFWLSGLFPIYDSDNMYKKLIEKNNWIFDFLPNWELIDPVPKRKIEKITSFFYRDFMDMFLGGLESFFQKKQLKIMPDSLAKILNQDTRVVANHQVIKLHFNDRRQVYNDLFQKKIQNLIN